MSRVIAPQQFFYVGGSIDAQAPSYVRRQADRELLAHIEAGHFCAVLTPRQMGKSSLKVRAVAELAKKHRRSVVIDLSGMIERGMTAEAFYAGLLGAFIQQLELPVDLTQWWHEHALLTSVQRFSDFIADQVLAHVQKKLVVFIDEIDSTLNLDFSDDFFAAIRALYNARTQNPVFERLTFVFLGAASPSDLVKDRTRTPFNIGRRVELTDFTFAEARTLAAGLPLERDTAEQYLTRVLEWTGDHPYLTQKVCAALTTANLTPHPERDVDHLIDTLFFSDATWSDDNLAHVRDRLVESKDTSMVLELYGRIRAGERVLDDERSPVYASLKLSGIVKVFPGGVLRPRNRIYERVFDLDWVDTVLRSRETGQPRAAGSAAQSEALRQAIADLERQQQTLSLDFSAQIAELQRRLAGSVSVTQSGSGAVATSGGVGAGAGGSAIGGDVRDATIVTGDHNVVAHVYTGQPAYDPEEALAIYRRVLLTNSRLTHLALCLAASGSESQQPRLARLPGWPSQEAALVPVFVTLRDFARWLPPGATKASPRHLWDFIVARLEAQNLASVAQPLHDRMEHGQVILLLDGLDEIPTRHQRTFIRDAVSACADRYAQCRMVVTCRTLSYQEPAWQLVDFEQATLAPFKEEQIDAFIAAWYAELARLGSIKPGAVDSGSRDLREAVRRPDLWRLATNPLLLIVMALVHTHKGRLPAARALLYEETVDILLWRWEQIKITSSGDEDVPQLRHLLTQADRTDVDLKRALWQLAFEAHRDGGASDTEAVADIGESRLDKTLVELHPDRSHDWARQVVEVMKHRAGLLLERTPEVYTFPHRTFQEYLAGAHLSAQPDFAQQAAHLVTESALWREVILLAVGRLVYLNGDTAKPLALVAELCPARHKQSRAALRQVWLAGDVLLEMGHNRVRDSTLGRELDKRLRPRLVRLLHSKRLRPVERAAAGNTLARLGDPRFRADAWYLPDEPLLGFVEIPAGAFEMGSDKKHDDMAYDDETPQHSLTLPRYYIARYPVTVAQFQAFVHDSGHTPEDADSLRGLPNHPVVWVSWHEALAYCAWLTERLRTWSDTPEPLVTLLRNEGWQVTLPSEAEWEKAARGADGRRYPWGNDPDPDRANYDDTGIGATSAVGCFPAGASPYGCLDMAGNVEEWTRSLWEKYPYPTTKQEQIQRENLQASNDMPRVLRGGAFWSDRHHVRCAYRNRFHPSARDTRIGIRVVVLP
jgi:formylglycine-generating enzyme required for sulfatase activity